MFVRQPTRAAVPSRSALHVMRQLALAGSTVGAIGSVCTITYEVHRRVRIAEQLVASKRELQSACPSYNAERGAATMAKMVEAAEAGEFLGLKSIKEKERKEIEHQGTSNRHAGNNVDSSESNIPMPSARRRANRTTGRFGGASSPGDSTHLESTSLETEKLGSPIEPGDRPRNNKPPPDLPPTPSLAKFRLKYHDTEMASDTVQIHRLLSQGKAIAAADRFLDVYAKPSGYIPKIQRELAVTLFYANIEDHNVFLARNIFSWLDRFDEVTPSLWELLLFALSKAGRIGSVADAYTRFVGTFELPPSLLAPVLKALLDTYRLTEAKNLIFQNLRHDQGCGLCGIYLHGIWKRTRDVQLMEAQFRKLRLELDHLGRRPTQKICDPLLKAYIELGQDEQAAALVEMMQRYKIPFHRRTLGLLAYGKALNCDWEGADDYLRKIYEHQKNGKTRDSRDMNKAFDRVFLEYWLCHTGDKIYDFVFHAFKDYEMVPDQVLFDHIVKALVQKGTPEMLSDLLQLSEEKSWKVNLDQEYFTEVLREHHLSSELSPAGLWRMFRATEHKFGYAASSRRILGYDRISFPYDESRKMPWTHEDTTWYRRALSMREPPKLIDQFAGLHNHMFHCLRAGKLQEVLSLFHTAKQSGKVMKRIHLELVTIASVMHYGCTSEAKIILQEEKDLKFGKPVPSQLFQTVLQADTMIGMDAYKFALLSFYGVLEQRLLPVNHSLLVSASTKLVLRREPEVAVELFRTANLSKYGAIKQFGDTAVKILTRAFGNTGNRKGVRWALITSLKRESARSQDVLVDFRRTVERLRRRESDHEKVNGHYHPDPELSISYFENLIDAIDARLKLDKRRTRRVETAVSTTSVKDYYKRSFRAATQEDTGEDPGLLDSEESGKDDLELLEARLSRWDERAELEHVFQDTAGGDETDVLDYWQEDNVLAESSSGES